MLHISLGFLFPLIGSRLCSHFLLFVINCKLHLLVLHPPLTLFHYLNRINPSLIPRYSQYLFILTLSFCLSVCLNATFISVIPIPISILSILWDSVLISVLVRTAFNWFLFHSLARIRKNCSRNIPKIGKCCGLYRVWNPVFVLSTLRDSVPSWILQSIQHSRTSLTLSFSLSPKA